MRGVDWIKYTNYVPFWMRHDPIFQGKHLNTPAMYWIKYVETEPPEWMRHDPTLRNICSDTLAMYWIKYVEKDPPEWVK